MPDMKEQLTRLYELQQTDTSYLAKRQALRRLDDGSATEARQSAAQQELAAAQARLRELETALLDRELHLKSTEDEQKARNKQAYGGTVSDPKQLRSLEQKIAELGRMKGKLEEETLELMEQLEAARAAAARLQGIVEGLTRQAALARERYTEHSGQLKRELRELKRHREGLVGGLDAGLVKQYEALLEKLDGLAVAVVRKGSCSGCKVTVPSLYAPALRSGSQVVKCENCRRILYLPQGESAFKPEEDR